MKADHARVWRLGRRVLLTLVAVACVYLGLANLLLGTGLLAGILNRKPDKFQIGWTGAWTIVPGTIEVRGLWLKGQTTRYQWMLEIERGHVALQHLPLLQRRFVADSIVANGVRYAQRRQRLTDEQVAAAQGYEPEIPGLPARMPRPELLAPSTKKHAWTLEFADITVDRIQQLWVDRYRLWGEGNARGAMRLQIRGPFSVSHASVALPFVEVLSGEQRVAESVSVDTSFSFAPFVVREHPGLALSRFLTGRGTVHGHFADFGFLNTYFAQIPWFKLRGAGDMDCSVQLEEGVVQAGSFVQFDSQLLAVRMRELMVAGQSLVAVRVEDGQTTLEADILEVAVGLAGGELTRLHGDGLQVRATNAGADLSQGFTELEVSLVLGESEVEDLSGLDFLVPESLPATLTSGSDATVAGMLRLNAQGATGTLALKGRDIEATFGHVTGRGDLELTARLHNNDPQVPEFAIAGSQLTVSNIHAAMLSSDIDEDWRATVKVIDGTFDGGPDPVLDAEIAVSMSDTTPLIEALVEPEKQGRLARLLEIDDLQAEASILMTPETFTFSDISVSGFPAHLFSGSQVSLSAAASGASLTEGLKGVAIGIRLTQVSVPDLTVVNSYLPRSGRVRLKSGSGLLDADVSLTDDGLSGQAELVARDVVLEVDRLQLDADLDVLFQLNEAQLEALTFDASGSAIRITNGRYRSAGGEQRSGWWATLKLEHAAGVLSQPMSMATTIDATMKNTRPLVTAFSSGDSSLLSLEELLMLEDVSARANLVTSAKQLAFGDLRLEGRGFVHQGQQGPGFSVDLWASEVDLEQGFSGLELSLYLPPSKISSLEIFNDLFPSTSGIRFSHGSSGEMSALLELDGQQLRGNASIRANGVGLQLGSSTVIGDLEANLKLNHGDLASKRYDLSGSEISISQARLPSASVAQDEPWSTTVELVDCEVELRRPLAVDTHMNLFMGDSRPMLSLLTRGGTNQWLEELLNFSQVKGSLDVKMDEDTLRFGQMQLEGVGDTSQGIFGPGLSVVVSGVDIDLSKGLGALELSVDLPESEVRDMSVFNRYLPAESGLTLLPQGYGTVSGMLNLNGNQGSGRFNLIARDIGVGLADASAEGDARLSVFCASDDFESASFDLSGSVLNLDNVRFAEHQGGGIQGWWAGLEFSNGTVEMGHPLSLQTHLKVRMKDTTPFVLYYSKSYRLVRWLHHQLSVDNISGEADLDLAPGYLFFDNIELVGDDLEVLAHARMTNDRRDALLFADYDGFAFGLAYLAGDRNWRLFFPRRWYKHKTRSIGLP